MFDLHYRISKAVGMVPGDDAANAVLESALADLYRSYAGSSLSTEELVSFLAANLAGHYREHGFSDIEEADVGEMVDAWSQRWSEQ